jgi:hypothetical protein
MWDFGGLKYLSTLKWIETLWKKPAIIPTKKFPGQFTVIYVKIPANLRSKINPCLYVYELLQYA